MMIGALSSAQSKSLQDARSLVGSVVYDEVQSTGKAVRLGKGSPSLLPSHPAAAPIHSAIGDEKPPVLVETIFILPRKAPSGAALLEAELASLYGLMRSISSLEGIEYYSASRKKMRTFYAESYLISDPKSKTRLPDPEPPAAGAIPRSESLFAFQRDLSFGSNVYRYDFESDSGAIRVTTTNMTTMSYSLVPVLSPGALKTRLLILQAEDAIVFYVESGASAPGLFKGKLEDSFSNRAEALFKWFSSKAAAFIKK